MIIVHCSQGSDAWHQERAGVITASMFSDARARLKSGPNKGEPTAKALDYAFRLAVERISGSPLDGGFETWQMKRGHELEPEARMEHEIQTGLIVTQVGLVKTDDGVFGASADGFIGEDGGSEYKCFLAPEKLRSFHIDNDASDIMDQVQGCMWITGRKWWHIGMYCPDLKPVGRQLWWQEFKRDEDYIEKLEEDLWQFKLLVDQYEAKLRSKAA
ncbi:MULTISPECIES: lambda exonuclease family protein [Pseudomonas]|uniref:lambda exonuclease family protein n=1 Tax=Pseudomonas TaxID=286 RepID=UPI0004AC0428|nr:MULTISPECIES: lambda exonuclease family protein [Pseudomonas]AIC20618.1 recombinase [Pseudomonas chlororaphis]AZC30087.1 Phage related protein [Pseudomonas chlororaphis subsp. piscium]AZD93067.1 Phage related protein [Pseudomonas chlororaphis subsp. aureofaciens]KAA5842291.1 YqaJ viral recombinase family protein [Pseudomonas chlororaphis]KAB0532775.1 YqaJ viral recombinase family protein [Pseudomonas chlororaphis subsp. aureofaciens]